MVAKSNLSRSIAAGALVLVGCVLTVLFSTRTVSGRNSDDPSGSIARGAGTTIIHGGTGASGGFVPVITTIAFNAARDSNGVSGSFECLAKAPAGSTSAQFTVNAMYVTGQVTGATVSGDTATLTGTATVTGLGGPGSDIPFTFIVQKGGPGATSVLTVGTLLSTPFNEILLEGSFDVAAEN
jgi:hypothetical protein